MAASPQAKAEVSPKASAKADASPKRKGKKEKAEPEAKTDDGVLGWPANDVALKATPSHDRSPLVALAVVPPTELWGPIQKIRAVHARPKQFKRWPPHVNILWPFMPPLELPDAVLVLKEALASVVPFVLELDNFSSFVHGKMAHFILDANIPELVSLHAVVAKLYPESEKDSQRGFHGHLTVGQVSGDKATIRQLVDTQCEKFQKDWQPPRFLVDHLVVLVAATADDPFEEYARVSIGPGNA